MFRELLTIKNYKLFIVNMMLIGMGIAITVPFFVLFATNQLGMTTNQFGLLLALAAISQFTMNSIVARFSDTHAINRKVIIIVGLFMGAISFTLPFFVHSVVLFIILYAIFKGYSLRLCPNFMLLQGNLLINLHRVVARFCQFCITFYVFVRLFYSAH